MRSPVSIVTLDDPTPAAHDASFAGAPRAIVLASATVAIWNGATTVRTDDPIAIDRVARTVIAIREARAGSERSPSSPPSRSVSRSQSR